MRAKPINNIFLSLTKPIQDTIKMGDIELYLDGSYRPEWNATVVGEVYSLPQFSKGDSASVVSQLKEGDKVLFDYSVVAERKFESDGDAFTETTKDSPYNQRFTNGKGDKLVIIAFQGKIAKQWVGTYVDKRGNFIDGVQGSEHDLERWKAQFNFSTTQSFVFKNLLDTGNKDVWKADYRDIFAKIKNDELITVSNRIILEPIDIEMPKDVIKQMGIVDTVNAKVRLGDRAKVISAPKDSNVKEGDVVGFEPQYVEKYEYNNKNYYLIKSYRALGVWEGNNYGI